MADEKEKEESAAERPATTPEQPEGGARTPANPPPFLPNVNVNQPTGGAGDAWDIDINIKIRPRGAPQSGGALGGSIFGSCVTCGGSCPVCPSDATCGNSCPVCPTAYTFCNQVTCITCVTCVTCAGEGCEDNGGG